MVATQRIEEIKWQDGLEIAQQDQGRNTSKKIENAEAKGEMCCLSVIP
jgi:hypothetical protein